MATIWSSPTLLFRGIPKLWNSRVPGYRGNGLAAVTVNAVGQLFKNTIPPLLKDFSFFIISFNPFSTMGRYFVSQNENHQSNIILKENIIHTIHIIFSFHVYLEKFSLITNF